ncbi:NAD-dependent protein deacylase [Paenibacillus albiflavus]|uniref:NAD-dependent protein deacetylase n=1 Tax=Paenibacillus albiflavus TaxID=2545760 RepID=A0A4R4EJY9_9BACL|nr:NAD-dependent protein deacylase [Paenibacillus albiflavus]TCZ80047.1 NAD-dependent protein deacylase [Paenibacillus albiflavus]
MNWNELKDLLNKSRNIVFFGGAGTSTESNIPDFRSASGLYKEKAYAYPPEVMLSHRFFMNRTEEFYDFYRSKMIYPDAMPNKAHLALAELERRQQLKAVITQNIDGLHQQAGSKRVIELHGSVHRNYCMDCGEKYDLAFVIDKGAVVPHCNKCGGIVKPDVVLYEEALDSAVIEQALQYISEADMLIIGGTSLTVQPAAGMIRYYRGDKLVLINQDTTPYDGHANFVIHDRVGAVLDALISE